MALFGCDPGVVFFGPARPAAWRVASTSQWVRLSGSKLWSFDCGLGSLACSVAWRATPTSHCCCCFGWHAPCVRERHGRLAIWSACISGYVDIGKLPFVLADFADGARAAADAHWWNVPLFMELAGLELYRLPSADLIFSDRLFFGDCVFVDSWSGHLG